MEVKSGTHHRADSVIKGGGGAATLRGNLLMGNTQEKFRSLSVIKERPSY